MDGELLVHGGLCMGITETRETDYASLFFVANPAGGVVLCLRLLPCHLSDVGGTTAQTLAVGSFVVSL